MQEKDFLKSCEQTLVQLSENIEIKDKNSKLDVEYSDGIFIK